MDLVKKFIENPNKDLIVKSSNWLKPFDIAMMGIDEAGRGPVLGPMVYAAAFYPLKMAGSYDDKRFADSKTLNEKQREEIFEEISNDPNICWIARIISPNTISTAFFRRDKYNLNEVSHDAATELVRGVLTTKVRVEELYVDTVGKPEKYCTLLKKRLPDVGKITVESKADAKFAVVSAASIVAKVLRDACVSNWQFPENADAIGIRGVKFGCGYPGDSTTISFLKKCFNPIFGFPTFIRFNWSTASLIVDSRGHSLRLDESLNQGAFTPNSGASSSKSANESGKRKAAITNYFTPMAKKIKSEAAVLTPHDSEHLQRIFHLNRVINLDQLFAS